VIETTIKDTLRLYQSEKFFHNNAPLSIDSIYAQKADSLKVKNFYIYSFAKNNKAVEEISYRESLFKGHELKKKSTETPYLNKSLDPFFSVYVFIALITAWIIFNYRKIIRQIFNAAFSNQKMQHLVREQDILKDRISIFLYITYVISFSFFVVQTFSFYIVSSEIQNLFKISVKLSLIIAFFVIIKWAVMHIIGVIFKNEEAASLYILNSYIYNVITSFFLIPLTFLIFYFKYDLNEFLINIGLIILLIINILRYFRYIIIGLTYSRFSHFYLILYLCTLEILPLLIIIKIFLNLKINNIEFF
jgi:hypothetical protein